MHYDPIKRIIGNAARKSPSVRKIFYFALGVVFLRTWYVKRTLRQLLAGKKEKFEIFDAGSGFGQYSYFCAKNFPAAKIHAVDVKEEQIDDCRKFFTAVNLPQVDFSLEDLTVPLHTDRFDCILSIDVMEHIEDDVTVFKNFFQAMKRGGVLVIHTPSNFGGSDVHEEGDTSFVEEHVRDGYSAGDITRKLKMAGFTMEKVSYTYGPAGSLAWRLGIKYPILMLGTGKIFFIVLPFYYLLTFWLTLILMYIDYSTTNTAGTGLSVVAIKE
jgi:SAM-dependent methyltransferase